MSDHPQDEQWDKALRAHPPIRTGRLDMASCTIDGEPVRYLYCDAWPERVAISGDHCDYIAYAANRAQPLMADNERLRAENERLRAALLAASKDLVDATYEDHAKDIKEFVHYALNKLGDAISPPNAHHQTADE